ncbi:TadE/TadG family type IV pilus assembly protein [Methylobacterium organophilum]|uniref:TadE-like domain-containing protein n=1 Tax=Methylobacterium organophilum TaxID=410 RepID=A0ABQ4T5G0_METOR|nr:TadE/TadG family type IV pilus assembly protein [Methylobacterium organophilum]GJE25774.1 hypothetical protein LKMONMHP_0614 [Methylobacterium organophilum]
MAKRSPRLPLPRFLRASEGGSVVEFGLVLPVMALILMATVEFAHAIDNYRKVTLLARTVSDLTAQGGASDPMDTSTMTDILASSKLVLTPFDSSRARIVVSALGVYPTTLSLKPYVCSSIASNATARAAKAVASDLTVPQGFQTAGMRYLLTEVTMPYKASIGTSLINYLTGGTGYTFAVSLPWPARGGATYNGTATEVTLPGGAPCPLTAP